MDKELVNKPISSEADLIVKFENGKIILEVTYEGNGAGGAVSINLSAGYFLDKLAAAIPGQLDDAIIAMIKGALGLK